MLASLNDFVEAKYYFTKNPHIYATRQSYLGYLRVFSFSRESCLPKREIKIIQFLSTIGFIDAFLNVCPYR